MTLFSITRRKKEGKRQNQEVAALTAILQQMMNLPYPHIRRGLILTIYDFINLLYYIALYLT